MLPGFISVAAPVAVIVNKKVDQTEKSCEIKTCYWPYMGSILGTPVICKMKYKNKSRKIQSKELKLDASLDFPFLCDQKTKAFIQQSKVLFILRGLPGSGKSTIVKTITNTYFSSIVCSADDYFLQDGVYKFDASCLSYAHSACQNKAKDACNGGVGAVLVDNTNVRRWEMKFYLELASHNDYIVIVVQPKTAWKWNPVELAARNKHGVDADTLRRKVHQFDDVIPVYYAWFLNHSSSQRLVFIAQWLMKECVQLFSDFRDRLLKQLHVSPAVYQEMQQHSNDAYLETDILSALFKDYYTSRNKAGSIVHCTAKFCGGGRAVGAKAYHSQSFVQNSLGQTFRLEISSICFSPRTVGARVQLNESQLIFFDKPEEKDWDGIQPHSSPARHPNSAMAATPLKRKNSPRGKKMSPGEKQASKKKTKREVDKVKEDSCEGDKDPSSSPVLGDFKPRNTNPVAKMPGRSAHITIGCAQGFESRETNFDVLRLCDMEASHAATDADYSSVTGGKARYFGDGVCCVYFDPPLYVSTIYSGFY